MKSQKILSLDLEIVEELKNIPNASKLINEMLKDYFNKTGHLKKQELKNKLIQLEADKSKIIDDMEIIKKQIEFIEEQESKINEVYKNIPKDIMDDIAFFNKMDLESLFNRYHQLYSKRFKDLNWEELKKAFIQFRGIKEDAQ